MSLMGSPSRQLKGPYFLAPSSNAIAVYTINSGGRSCMGVLSWAACSLGSLIVFPFIGWLIVLDMV